MELKIKVTGLAELQDKLRAVPSAVAQAAAAALYQEAENVMTASKGLVPVQTGALRASGYVQPPAIGPSRTEVTLGYGDDATAYALKQHEDMNLHHPHGGQAKYLEQPLMEAAPRISSTIAQRIEERVGK